VLVTAFTEGTYRHHFGVFPLRDRLGVQTPREALRFVVGARFSPQNTWFDTPFLQLSMCRYWGRSTAARARQLASQR